MLANFCSECNFTDYPNCILKQVIRNIAFEELLINNQKYEEYVVCPLNAQKIYKHKLELTEKCDNCNFCKLLCINYEKPSLFNFIKSEKVVFSDYNRLQMLLKKWNPNLKVASEVNFRGNFRTKRLDLVIINNSEVLLIKVLKDDRKFNYYYRLLESIKKEYSALFDNLNFKSLFLVNTNSINKSNESIINIHDLLNLTRRF